MAGDTVASVLRQATQTLDHAGVPGAARDARVVLGHMMGVAPSRLGIMGPDPVSADQLALFQALIDRRLAREPVSHLTGQREFYGRSFQVGPDVLDPRPETEMLVEAALALPWDTVLDLGTGSGAILLTLLAERSGTTGLGRDISGPALNIATNNAVALGLGARVQLEQGSWADGLTRRFDLVTCNPPYISQPEYDALDPEPRLWEPKIALTPGGDGLQPYSNVSQQLNTVLNPGGYILFEIGPTQAKAVAGYLSAVGFAEIRVIQDLDGRDRVIHAQKPD